MAKTLSDDDVNKIAQRIDESLDARGVATKDDLKRALRNTATKKDLKKMASKADLKSFATKDDLKALLSKDEFNQRYNTLLQNIVTNATFDERVKSIVNEVLDEKIKNLPTKEEFFARMDRLSGEYKKNDEEHTIQASKLSNHEDKLEDHDIRITALEQPAVPKTA